jgi:hypothetical protein
MPIGLAARVLLCALTLLAMRPAAAEEWIYVVQPGDNPWTITEQYLKGVRYWPRLQRHSRCRAHCPRYAAAGTHGMAPAGARAGAGHCRQRRGLHHGAAESGADPA